MIRQRWDSGQMWVRKPVVCCQDRRRCGSETDGDFIPGWQWCCCLVWKCCLCILNEMIVYAGVWRLWHSATTLNGKVSILMCVLQSYCLWNMRIILS